MNSKLVSKETIMDMIDKAVGEKCQPDYITALPYARATTVEEVDKSETKIGKLQEEREKQERKRSKLEE